MASSITIRITERYFVDEAKILHSLKADVTQLETNQTLH